MRSKIATWGGLGLLYCTLAPLITLLAFLFYRQSYVWRNITQTLPHYHKRKRLSIFLRHYCYLGIWCSELVWLSFASEKMIEEFMRFDKNLQSLLETIEKDKRVLVLSAHFANWEMLALRLSILSLKINSDCNFSYRPLHNLISDRLMKTLRSRFNGTPVPEKQVLRKLKSLGKASTTSLFCSLVDHNPLRLRPKSWLRFLGTEIPLTGGPYYLARTYDAPIYMMAFLRPSLFAPYTINLIPMAKPPYSLKDKVPLLRSYTKHITDMVSAQPHMWMWSICRHKYQRQPNEPLL